MTKQNLMRIRTSHLAFLLVPLATSLLGLSFSATAQQPGKVCRIGYLTAAPLSAFATRIEAFQQGLRELGYIEGKSIVIEWRSGEGKLDRLPALAAELVRLKVDVIVTVGPTATRPAKAATATIPIIMAQDDDPVVNGFVASLARPGGNITGVTSITSELYGKRLELLKEAVPRASLVAVLKKAGRDARDLEELQAAARSLRLQLQVLDVQDKEDFERAFRAATDKGAHGLITLRNPLIVNGRKQIIDLAAKSKLPAIYDERAFVDAGGLMSYGTDLAEVYRHAATYVDKILKGRKPADLPVEQPRKFELIINLKAAKQIGLTIPPNVLVRADKVIR